MKQCSKCNQTKDDSEFYKNGSKVCKLCRREYDKQNYSTEKRRQKYASYEKDTVRRWGLKSRYNITLEDYEKMVADQAGQCAICKQLPEPGKILHVDHCHTTNQVRGLLCGQCNVGIGYFKDNPERLAAAISYLK